VGSIPIYRSKRQLVTANVANCFFLRFAVKPSRFSKPGRFTSVIPN
jgi:hypothetical protein